MKKYMYGTVTLIHRPKHEGGHPQSPSGGVRWTRKSLSSFLDLNFGFFRRGALLTAQRHGDRAHRRARGASQADAGAEESEFEDLVLGQLLKIGDFQNRHARFG